LHPAANANRHRLSGGKPQRLGGISLARGHFQPVARIEQGDNFSRNGRSIVRQHPGDSPPAALDDQLVRLAERRHLVPPQIADQVAERIDPKHFADECSAGLRRHGPIEQDQ
jgi:hypothetical protein